MVLFLALALTLFGLWLYFLLLGWRTPDIKMDIGLLIVSILLFVVGIISFLFLTFGAIWSDDLGIGFEIAFYISLVLPVFGLVGIVVSLIKIWKLWKLRH